MEYIIKLKTKIKLTDEQLRILGVKIEDFVNVSFTSEPDVVILDSEPENAIRLE